METALRYKYPRTPHLPWSPGVSADDERIIHCDHFLAKEVVVTEKIDGENTTMYGDYIHARSIDGRHHPSRDWVKQLHGRIAHEIPSGWRFCGENAYARHSIQYDNLPSYFFLFSIWNERNECISWDETTEWARLLNIELPQELYRGIWDEERIRQIFVPETVMEGYVVRSVTGYHYHDFPHNIAKWVRKGHVQTNEHWMFAQIVPNGLAKAEIPTEELLPE